MRLVIAEADGSSSKVLFEFTGDEAAAHRKKYIERLHIQRPAQPTASTATAASVPMSATSAEATSWCSTRLADVLQGRKPLVTSSTKVANVGVGGRMGVLAIMQGDLWFVTKDAFDCISLSAMTGTVLKCRHRLFCKLTPCPLYRLYGLRASCCHAVLAH